MESKLDMALNGAEREVMKVLSERGSLTTRLAEKSDGDHEFFQHGSLEGFSLPGSEFICALHRLRDRGLVVCNSEVDQNDSSQYEMSWTATARNVPVDS